MLKSIAFLALTATVLFVPTRCGTFKRKRDSEPMVNDYLPGNSFANYYDQDMVTGYFYIIYKKKFDPDWLDPATRAFAKEAKKVKKSLSTLIAHETSIMKKEIDIIVDSFILGSTRAEVSISIPTYYGIDGLELSRIVKELKNNADISGFPIIEVEDLSEDIPTMQEKAIIVELTYENDVSDQADALADSHSKEFKKLAADISSQMSLLLMAQIERMTSPVSASQIEMQVNKILSSGVYTKAEIRAEVDNVNIDDVSLALQGMVLNGDQRISGHLIIGIDELDREVAVYSSGDEPRIFGEGPEEESYLYFPNGFGDEDGEEIEELPEIEVMTNKADIELIGEDYYDNEGAFEQVSMKTEVMTNKEEDNLNHLPEGGSDQGPVTGSDDFVIVPDVVEQPLSVESEPTEPTPPEDPVEPTPPESCPKISAPHRGAIECRDGNEIGSVCQFSCQENTRMEGTDTILCGLDGNWNEDPPYCIRIFCQPPVTTISDGFVECTDSNRYHSVCTISCIDHFRLVGSSSMTCQRSEKWNASMPRCELVPIDCEEEYGPWSECVNGSRTKEEVIAKYGSATIVCPKKVEVCIDCQLRWGEWSECTGNLRSRKQLIQQPRVGDGKKCPEAQSEEQECVPCEVEWNDWSDCINETRNRKQSIVVSPIGYGCPEIKSEVQECLSCVVQWGEWSSCKNSIAERKQVIIRQPTNGGNACPDLNVEQEACQNCLVNWSHWSTCDAGKTRRTTIITQSSQGRGESCPSMEIEEEGCRNCVTKWSNWTECFGGHRKRLQVISQSPIGIGKECPDLRTEEQVCVHCELEWGDWESCVDGLSKRRQFIAVEKKGSGRECPLVKEEYRACAECQVEWDDWGECQGGERIRSQRITQQPINVVDPCPELTIEFEHCNDCMLEWGEWGSCENNMVRRAQYIAQPAQGGKECMEPQTESEYCQDCIVDWSPWSGCSNGERVRQETVIQNVSGAGKKCPDTLAKESEECIDCVVDWTEWSTCEFKERNRQQFIKTQSAGAGKPCPMLGTEVERCINCVVEWSDWSKCFSGIQKRKQVITVDQVGAGSACPSGLQEEERLCEGVRKNVDTVICRFVGEVLGYRRKQTMRDLLLIGDESGSIGWINFEKIKRNFKSIARNIQGGIGSQETQIGMTSFALFSRILFDFNDHQDVDGVVAAIDKVYFKGGYRSRIGDALEDANTWLFQQASGMRSFPDIDDNIEHEILIATDGCRTSDKYQLQESLKVIRSRGVKLYVLGIETPDSRCRQTVQSMVDNPKNLFMLGSWEELDEMTKSIDEGACFESSGIIEGSAEPNDSISDDTESQRDGGTKGRSRGDGAVDYEAVETTQ